MSTLSVLDAARESAAALALVVGGRELRMGELAERVRSRLGELAALPELAAPGAQLVAFAATESLATLELIYALLELKKPFLPLHARLTPDERERLLARLPVGVLIEPSADEGLRFERRAAAAQTEQHRAWFERSPQLAALATSGSSGAPNVVLLSRDAFLSSARASAINLGWQPDDRWLLCLPLAHIGGLSVVTRCLLARRPVVLGAEARAGESAAQRLAASIEHGRPSLLSLVPTQLSSLLQLEPRFQLPAYVRAILTGGAAASPALLHACVERRWPIVTSYGLTEACSQVATHPLGASLAERRGAGRLLHGMEARLGPGGVIQLRGPALLSGYLVGPSDAVDAEGWFTTGDLGRIDPDGVLDVLGRADHVIISGGENVAPGEVEAALESCPGVLEACVFPVADAHWGQLVAAGLRLGAGDAEQLLAAVQSELERRLAAFKRPRCYAIAGSFAYGPTGKLDRLATARQLLGQLTPARR
jgi:O-succinylbenzoic acid--CoA ligase